MGRPRGRGQADAEAVSGRLLPAAWSPRGRQGAGSQRASVRLPTFELLGPQGSQAGKPQESPLLDSGVSTGAEGAVWPRD